jgi:periplasmic protein CpxP/Spy
MKKHILIALVLLSASIAAYAQPQGGGGGFQRRTPAERAAVIHQKLDSAFKLEPAKLAMIDTALTVLYKRQDARTNEIREAMMSGGERPDMEAMREEFKKYTDAQEEILKAVLTAEQYTIWKDQIQPAMRPARPMGGGQGGGGWRGGGNN